MHIVTINTDAGFYPTDKVGSFAYWIKSNGLFLKGSGLIKQPVKNPTEAEMMAIINAVSVLKKSSFRNIRKIVFNRDNIYTKSSRNGNDLEKMLNKLLGELRTECDIYSHVEFWEFRHVKAHSGTETARQYVNDWCDKECTRQLREWKSKQLKNHELKSPT